MSVMVDNKLKNMELKLLEEVFGSQNQVAKILSVDRSSITRWHRGENPDSLNSLKISGLNYLISILKIEYNQNSILKWFRGVNYHLQNQKPIDLIARGRINDVIQAASQDVAGSYA